MGPAVVVEPHLNYLFNTSLSALAGVKARFLEAATVIFSPVAGLRPSRSSEALALNFPNPGIEVSASELAASAMAWNTASTMDAVTMQARAAEMGIALSGDRGVEAAPKFLERLSFKSS